MARAAQTTRPIEALSEAVRSLEAAALVCLASPKKKPVHQLRTWTRRVEAQLELIAMLPGIRVAQKPRDKVLRILKKLRRGAGTVRDLDVERELISAEMVRLKDRSQATLALRKQGSKLRGDLRQKRAVAAERLKELLKKERIRLPIALKELSRALNDFKSATVTEAGMIDLVSDWYLRCATPHIADESKTLHAVRKRAKLARYMIESRTSSAQKLGANVRSQRLSMRFETIQHAGGTWHDLLQLSETAAKELGHRSSLGLRFAEKADRALHSFRRCLAQPIVRSRTKDL